MVDVTVRVGAVVVVVVVVVECAKKCCEFYVVVISNTLLRAFYKTPLGYNMRIEYYFNLTPPRVRSTLCETRKIQTLFTYVPQTPFRGG